MIRQILITGVWFGVGVGDSGGTASAGIRATFHAGWPDQSDDKFVFLISARYPYIEFLHGRKLPCRVPRRRFAF